MSISLRTDRPNNLTTFIVRGEILADEILSALKLFYENPEQPATLNILIDLREIHSAPTIKDEDLSRIVSYSSNHADKRKGGKTAMVARSDFEFYMSKKYELFTQLKGLSITVVVFRSFGEAMMWLEK